MKKQLNNMGNHFLPWVLVCLAGFAMVCQPAEAKLKKTNKSNPLLEATSWGPQGGGSGGGQSTQQDYCWIDYFICCEGHPTLITKDENGNTQVYINYDAEGGTYCPKEEKYRVVPDEEDIAAGITSINWSKVELYAGVYAEGEDNQKSCQSTYIRMEDGEVYGIYLRGYVENYAQATVTGNATLEVEKGTMHCLNVANEAKNDIQGKINVRLEQLTVHEEIQTNYEGANTFLYIGTGCNISQSMSSCDGALYWKDNTTLCAVGNVQIPFKNRNLECQSFIDNSSSISFPAGTTLHIANPNGWSSTIGKSFDSYGGKITTGVQFISSVAVSCNSGSSSAWNNLTNNGYSVINKDYNQGCGSSSDYVYIGYKTTTNPADAITDLIVVEGSRPGSITVNGKTYWPADYYGNADLNCSAGGKYLYLYYTRDKNTDTSGETSLVTAVNCYWPDGQGYETVHTYYTNGNQTGNDDLNWSAGGDYVYLTRQKAHQHGFFRYTHDGDQCRRVCQCNLLLSTTSHSYGTPSFEWHGTTSCEYSFTCANCGYLKELNTIDIQSSVTKEPTCATTGVRTYYATVENPVTHQTYTSTCPTTVEVPVWEHDLSHYPEGEYCSTCGRGFIHYTSTDRQSIVPAASATFGTAYRGSCINAETGNGFMTFDGRVTSIGDNAFKDCANLSSVTIPSSVTVIGSNAFLGCDHLTSVTSLSTTPPDYDRSFSEAVRSNIPLYVPGLSVAAYRAHSSWSRFQSISCTAGTHDYSKRGEAITEATCATQGLYHRVCMYCDAESGENMTVPASGLHVAGEEGKCVSCGMDMSNVLSVINWMALNGATADVSIGGTYEWRIDDDGKLTSTNQGKHNTDSKTTITLVCEKAMNMLFDYAVSSESGYDKLTIKVDDETLVNAISGTNSGTVNKALSAGTHTLTLLYHKDSSTNNGSDCGSISNFVLCPHTHEGVSTLSVVETAATCKDRAYTTYTCSLCNTIKTVVNEASPLGDHTPGEDGNCTVCGTNVSNAQSIIDWLTLYGVTATACIDGSYMWAVDSNDKLSSTNQGLHSTDSKTVITLVCEQSFTLSFDYAVSSETRYDKLTIKVDNKTLVNAISGTDSGTINEALSSGTHTLTLLYQKDGSQNGGSDCGSIWNFIADRNCDHQIEGVMAWDVTHSSCSICHHGFISYEADARVTPSDLNKFLNARGTVLKVINNAYDEDECHYVMELGGELTTIGEGAFQGCTGLDGLVTLPNTVSVIGKDAFKGCENVEILLQSIPEVGEDALANIGSVEVRLTDQSSVTTQEIEFEADQVSYTRQMASQWGSLTVPFALTVSENDAYDLFALNAAYGSAVSLTKVNNGTTIPAGTPLFVRMKEESTEGYLLEIVQEDCSLTTAPNDGAIAKGTYLNTDVTGVNGYILANDEFWNIQQIKGSNTVWVAPFRSFLQLPNNATKMRIEIDAEETAIEQTEAEETDGIWYNLQGQRLHAPQKGIHIQRGKKTLF